MREIVFDTETTGFSFKDGDRMVEIGCVELINKVETGRTFHAYFHPERTMPAEAQRIHGLSDVFLSDKPLFHAQVEALLEFLGRTGGAPVCLLLSLAECAAVILLYRASLGWLGGALQARERRILEVVTDRAP